MARGDDEAKAGKASAEDTVAAPSAELAVSEEARRDTSDPEVTAPDGPAAPPVASVAVGECIGRYVVTSRLGQGGMGVVYAAFDPELDRKVALKLLHPRPGVAASEGRSRLIREAQAIAQVTHPNVITVHDVGPHRGQVFVAMELVDGETLKAWQESGHPWRDIVAMYIEAGRGLAAAHRAGLVHRDFKPQNVMIGSDGRPRVMDFGLARSATATSTARRSENIDVAAKLAVSSLEVELTRTGTVMGTPSYMSPEQMQGAIADARSDQFSFCVALWEGLYGERPFAGVNLASLVLAVMGGEIKSPPSGHAAPARMRRTLLRGLRVEPDDRFASIDELIDELAGHTRGPGRRWALAGAATAAVGTAYGLGTWQDEDTIACVGAQSYAVELWPGTRRAATAGALGRVDLPYAQDVSEQFVTEIDGWVDAWARQRVDACEATHVRHEQSAQMLDRRGWCASRLANKLDALLGVVEDADEATVRKALDLLGTLPDPALCRDPESFDVIGDLPPSDGDRRTLDAISGELDVIIVLERAGELEQAKDRFAPLLERVRALNRPTALAQVLDVRARLESGSGEPTRAKETVLEALAAAFEGGDAHQTAQIATRAMDYVAEGGQHLDEALGWSTPVRGLIARAGDPLDLRVGARTVEASLLRQAGRVDEAMTAARDTLAMYEELEGPTGPNMAWAHEHVGLILQMQGHPEEAITQLERSLELERDRYGSRHPRVATSLSNLGIAYGSVGRVDDCARVLEEALEISTAVYGPNHVNLAAELTNLGEVRAMQGRHEETLELNTRALALREAAHGPAHASQIVNLTNLGAALGELARWDEAVARLERAVVVSTDTLGADHPSTALALFHLSSAYEGLKRRPAAIDAAERTLAIWRDKLGPDHPNVGAILVNLGALRLPDDGAAALATMREGISLLEGAYGPEHRDVVVAKGQLTQALRGG